jgi:mitochondrial fission protein ELM1
MPALPQYAQRRPQRPFRCPTAGESVPPDELSPPLQAAAQAQCPALPSVWCLLGRKAGDNTQVTALAEALGWPWEARRIQAHSWELLTHLGLGVTLAGIDRRRSDALEPPWPDLVISAGRRNEPVARWIQRQAASSGHHCRLVHIGRPWAPLSTYDLIVTTPQYFLPQAPNIRHNGLPLHAHASLAAEAVALAPRLEGLPAPRVAVLLGGDSGPFVFTEDKARRLAALLNRLLGTAGGSVLLIGSPRTPPQAFAACAEALRVPAFVHPWSGVGDNPYRGVLGTADAFVVTAESMSMLAEAASLGRPLYLFDLADDDGRPWWRHSHAWRYKPLSHRLAMRLGPERMRRDVARMQQALVAGGTARWLDSESVAQGLRTTIPAGSAVDLSGDELAETAREVRALFDAAAEDRGGESATHSGGA